VIRALSEAIDRIRTGSHDPFQAHERVRGMYSWDDVAARTEAVYRSIIEGPPQRGTYERMMRSVYPFPSLWIPFAKLCHTDVSCSAHPRLRVCGRLLATGPIFGYIMLIIFAVQHLFYYFLEGACPRSGIDVVPTLEEHGVGWDQRRMEKVSVTL
jgi:phosphatidylinositol glycan class A protein